MGKTAGAERRTMSRRSRPAPVNAVLLSAANAMGKSALPHSDLFFRELSLCCSLSWVIFQTLHLHYFGYFKRSIYL